MLLFSTVLESIICALVQDIPFHSVFHTVSNSFHPVEAMVAPLIMPSHRWAVWGASLQQKHPTSANSGVSSNLWMPFSNAQMMPFWLPSFAWQRYYCVIILAQLPFPDPPVKGGVLNMFAFSR